MKKKLGSVLKCGWKKSKITPGRWCAEGEISAGLGGSQEKAKRLKGGNVHLGTNILNFCS